MLTPIKRLSPLLLVLLISAPASAQTFEQVGIRALGMGGAFVAVADDASATWWNPAGLGTGAYLNALIERTTTETIPGRGTPTAGESGATRDTGTSFALAFPALGLSYYRVQASAVGAAAAGAPGPISMLRTSQFGLTLVQSLLPGVVVGSTLKFVRGTVASVPGTTGDSATQALARADQSTGPTSGAFDLDLGLMATTGPLHLGITAKNVREPRFAAADGGPDVTLARDIRIGAAVAPELSGSGVIDAFTVAIDGDVTRTITVLGVRRPLAAGAEAWLLGRRLGVRGGVRINTLGARLPIGTAGASVALHSGVYVEGEISRGQDPAARGWGIGARLTF